MAQLADFCCSKKNWSNDAEAVVIKSLGSSRLSQLRFSRLSCYLALVGVGYGGHSSYRTQSAKPTADPIGHYLTAGVSWLSGFSQLNSGPKRLHHH